MLFVRRFPDAQRIRQREALIAQKRKSCAQPGLERGLNLRRIDADHRDTAVGDLRGVMELYQFPQLQLSLRSPRAAVERQDEGISTGHRGNGHGGSRIVRQCDIGENVAGFQLEGHGACVAGEGGGVPAGDPTRAVRTTQARARTGRAAIPCLRREDRDAGKDGGPLLAGLKVGIIATCVISLVNQCGHVREDVPHALFHPLP